MLEELHVRNLALIEEAWLEFGPGMTVLTGETGAGKTALVGALKLLLGERADSTMVRSGSEGALVEGRFTVGEDELFARRTLTAEGRSRCTLGGEMATVGLLGERLGGLVDLHGQHEHQSLLRPSVHVQYLDRYIGRDVEDALASYRSARAEYERVTGAVAQLESSLADGERRADYLRFVIQDIDAVAPVPGEEEQMEQRLPALRYGERLAEAAAEAHQSLRGDAGAADLTARARDAIVRVSSLDPALDEIEGRLEGLSASLNDLGMELRAYGDGIVHDAAELDVVESRMAALSGLKKKYGPRFEDVLETRDEAAGELATLDAGEEGLEEARRLAKRAAEAVDARASELRSIRHTAVPGFVQELSDAVADLAMGGATFDVSFSELARDQWTYEGPDRIEFLYAPSPGQPARPLARIASGGEVSRVMLALKSVLNQADDVPVLVFDEVDAGIGGATAQAVGRRLKDLARNHQVLVITHLAQVAVHADHHLVVSKSVVDDSARTEVRGVSDDERVEEIARMLSGGESAASIEHARDLMASVLADA